MGRSANCRCTSMISAVVNPIIELTFDRGTLVLRGLSHRDGWDFDSRIGALRSHAIEYAASRASLMQQFGDRFVAALVSCRNWEMHTTVATRWGRTATVKLDSEAGYRTHITAPADFDSQVESDLAEKWGETRDGWRLIRDAGILQYGQTTFVPDFKLKHEDGREMFLEIVGFWTPEYLAAKRETIKKFRDHRILLAIPVKTAKADGADSGAIVYRTKIDPDEVVRAAELRPQI
jgi:uncharacterized protein